VPSIDVIHALEDLNLPFTGPTSRLYDPSKDLMKLVALSSGVAVPAWQLVGPADDVKAAASTLRFPLFVKPSAYGDSMGIDEHSLVASPDELEHQVAAKLPGFGRLLVEEYVDGREFTVLVLASRDPGMPPAALTPIEFLFPPGLHFKTYDLKVTQFHPECNVPCTEPELAGGLQAAAIRAFTGFTGEGYARMDFRVDAEGRVFFLEANFTCSVFYPEGYQGSADYILAFDGIGQAGFLRAIIDEGSPHMAAASVRGQTSRDGFAMFAARDLARGSIVSRRSAAAAHRHAVPRRANLAGG
jgi:D-alanine-D-alanine ligase